jgi:hypothetical protein
MSDGFFIRFREMVPDEGLLHLALAEIDQLHEAWPERVQCNIVIAHGDRQSKHEQFDARVELELGRGNPIAGSAACADPYAALRTAFRSLRKRIPMVA